MTSSSLTTRELYMLKALKLFSEKGYGATGVAEIARAVGCTTSALYKHFPNKKALFDAIVEKSKNEFHEHMQRIHRNIRSNDDNYISHLSEDNQIHMMLYLFNALTEDSAPKYFRKLVNVEHSEHPELSEIYNKYYIDVQFRAFEELIRMWISKGVIRDEDPEMITIQYVSPLLMLIDVCDREPERKDAAREMIRRHIRQFNRAYKLK